jgi:hypothetical protein
MKIKRAIIALVSIGISAAIITPLAAFELAKEQEFVKIVKADFDGDGVVDEAVLVPKKTKRSEGWYNYNLEVRSKGAVFVFADATVSNDYSCGLEIITVSRSFKPFIGVSQRSGRHSWLLILYAFDGQQIKKVDTFLSDIPSIEVNDVDRDGENEIVVITKDRDRVNQLIDTFNYDGRQWRRTSVYSTKMRGFLSPKKWR